MANASRFIRSPRPTIPLGDRGVLYSFIYFSAKHLGQGQFYVMEIKDRDGQPFEGVMEVGPQVAFLKVEPRAARP